MCSRPSRLIRIAGLTPFVISDGFAVIDTAVRAAYQATYDLLRFWQSNAAIFDRAVADGAVALSNARNAPDP